MLEQSNKYYDDVDSTIQVTIRAIATSRDGSKQSSVVTKTFTVREAVENSGESDNEMVCMSLHLVYLHVHIDVAKGIVRAIFSKLVSHVT